MWVMGAEQSLVLDVFEDGGGSCGYSTRSTVEVKQEEEEQEEEEGRVIMMNYKGSPGPNDGLSLYMYTTPPPLEERERAR
jgi:hypothetical protein